MDHRVTHAIKRMQQDLHTNLSFQTLAAEVGLSVSRLGYLFRQHTRISPGAYLQALRMDRARLLIESTNLSVRDVMRQVGLADPSHFARDFRNAHGLSPRAYRLQLRMAGPPTRYGNGPTHTLAHVAAHLRTNRPLGPRPAAAPTVNDEPPNQGENKKCC